MEWTVAVLGERPTCAWVVLVEDRVFLPRRPLTCHLSGSSGSGGKSGLRSLLDACRLFPFKLSAWAAIERKVRRDGEEYDLQVSAWSQVRAWGT